MDDAPAICSAKGCGAAAEYKLVWNNPKIHEPDREKIWLACADHRDTLGEFLRVRGFLRRIDPFSPPTDAAGHTPADATGAAPAGAAGAVPTDAVGDAPADTGSRD